MKNHFLLFFPIFIFKSICILVKVTHPSSPDEIFSQQPIESVIDILQSLKQNSFISLSDFTSQSHEIKDQLNLKNMTLLFKFYQTYLLAKKQ